MHGVIELIEKKAQTTQGIQYTHPGVPKSARASRNPAIINLLFDFFIGDATQR